MASYTQSAPVTFSAAQEAGFDRKLFLANQRRAALTPPLPALTKQQYFDALIQALPAEWMLEFRDDFKERCGVVLATTTVAKLLNVATELGIDPNPYD